MPRSRCFIEQRNFPGVLMQADEGIGFRVARVVQATWCPMKTCQPDFDRMQLLHCKALGTVLSRVARDAITIS